jgi:aldose 1-epimerase
MPSLLSSQPFGELPDGRAVTLFTLTNTHGHVVTLTDYGATIVGITVPDRAGKFADVALGFDDLAGFLSKANPYFGCVVGRFGNRIAKGRFTLEGHTYQLAVNNGPNHLHGGLRGFDKLLWKASVAGLNPPSVRFSLLSPDGDEGYPGNLSVEVTYTWTDDSELRLDYSATTDRATIVNLTNHVYLNLAGQGVGDVLGHLVRMPAENYVPVDATLIPTGKLASVAGTPMDFLKGNTIGSRLAATGGDPAGYDHTFVLKTAASADTVLAAEVTEPTSGRRLRVFTAEPGVQFYTGNFLDGSFVGKAGARYARHTGFCLETQHFPDAPNQPAFPSVVLRPDQTYRTSTSYRFDTV